MLRRFTRKRALVALTAIAVLGISAAAIAYFSTSGTGTGQAKVGTSTALSVTAGTTTGTMYPGTGTSTVPYTITNPTGSGVQNLSGTSVSVASDTTTGSPTLGDILDHGTAVSGCLASWFTPTDHPPAYGEIADGSSKSGSVTVVMADVNSSQDSCKTHTPDVTVNAS
jgi:hypothetical protein